MRATSRAVRAARRIPRPTPAAKLSGFFDLEVVMADQDAIRHDVILFARCNTQKRLPASSTSDNFRCREAFATMESAEHARTVIRRIFFVQIGIFLAFVIVVVVLSIHTGEAGSFPFSFLLG